MDGTHATTPRTHPRSAARSTGAGAFALCVATLAGMLAPGSADAQQRVEPIQLSLVAPAQIYPESASIHGVRLSLFYGSNQDVYGLDLLFVGLNRVRGDFVGVSWDWIGVSWVEGTATGWQGALVNLSEGGFTGLQTGAVNVDFGTSIGAALAVANVATEMTGFQGGLVNVAQDFRGLQLGLVNFTRRMHGVQIGLVNVITEGKLPFMVIANASFR